tara:strand:- start:60 stop:344 length:285 start_codon:yes stop_codon:yes gene_type:complete
MKFIISKHAIFLIIISSFLSYSLFFSKDNFFILNENFHKIRSLNNDISFKTKKKKELQDYHYNFQNNSAFRKQVIKNELFLKNNDEKVILYQIN